MTARGQTWAGQVAAMEADGRMAARRAALAAWFDAHPGGAPEEAVRELGFSYPYHMIPVADAIWTDRRRAAPG